MPSRLALLIGNSSFRHKELARLSAPQDDVRAFAKVLEDPEICGFDKVDLKLDIGPIDAKAAIGKLYRNRHPDDVVLFYYSGHGLLDAAGRFYLAMTPTDPDDPDPGSIDEVWLRGLMDGSASQRQLAILDCCHSGKIIPEGMTARDAATGPVLTERTLDPAGHGRFILAATTAGQSAFEQDGKSIYTRHLVEGLKTGGAAPEKPEISVFDLHEFVTRRVQEDAPDLMRPQLWRDATLNPTDTPLVIARNISIRPKLDDKLVADLWSSEHARVDYAVLRLIAMGNDPGDPLQDDARRVLGERLAQGETLSYSVGARIAGFLDSERQVDAAALETAEARAAELDRACGALEKELSSKTKKTRELQERIDSATAEREALTSYLRKAETRAAELDRARGVLEAELSSATGKLHELQERIDAAAAERGVLTDDLDAARVRDADLDSRRSALQTEVSSLSATLLRWRAGAGVGAVVAMIAIFALWDRNQELRDQISAGIVAATEDDVSGTKPFSTFRECDDCPEMVSLPGGEFRMGSPADEEGRNDDEGPQRDVTVARFALAETEVTFAQWDACVADGGCGGYLPDDAGWGRGDRPVINVSWADARAYIDWLNGKVEGSPYRLPSEAEWEYAARAVTQTRYAFGNDITAAQANFARNVGRTVLVGELDAENGWGLRHMHGNVWEWTEDCWHGSYKDAKSDARPWLDANGGDCSRRVVRGGSWSYDPWNLRSANRNRVEPEVRDRNLGFRPARTPFTP